MVNKFLRTAPTRTLLGAIAAVLVVIGGGAAIAVAAQGSGPVPKPKRLAVAIRSALAAPQVNGVSADISFTNRLIGASELQGSDPLLQGGNGHIWISSDGQFRLELYGDNGDPEIVVNHGSWWVSDPTLQTVYEGKLPAQAAHRKHHKPGALPTVAQIQAAINRLAQHLHISGAAPTDVAGQPTYTVTVSPRQAGGLVGKLQLAWDAVRGVPLRFAVYARGDGTPVLELAATNVSYGSFDSSVFALQPPSGYHSTSVSVPSGTASAGRPVEKSKKHAQIAGVRAVARHLSFKLNAPARLDGLSRSSASLLGHGTLLVYGQGLGGIAVIEQPATATSARQLQLSQGSGDHQNGIALPTFSVQGATAQELDTALGTLVRFTWRGVTYTVVGSITPRLARAAARAL